MARSITLTLQEEPRASRWLVAYEVGGEIRTIQSDSLASALKEAIFAMVLWAGEIQPPVIQSRPARRVRPSSDTAFTVELPATRDSRRER